MLNQSRDREKLSDLFGEWAMHDVAFDDCGHSDNDREAAGPRNTGRRRDNTARLYLEATPHRRHSAGVQSVFCPMSGFKGDATTGTARMADAPGIRSFLASGHIFLAAMDDNRRGVAYTDKITVKQPDCR